MATYIENVDPRYHVKLYEYEIDSPVDGADPETMISTTKILENLTRRLSLEIAPRVTEIILTDPKIRNALDETSATLFYSLIPAGPDRLKVIAYGKAKERRAKADLLTVGSY